MREITKAIRRATNAFTEVGYVYKTEWKRSYVKRWYFVVWNEQKQNTNYLHATWNDLKIYIFL